jgi:2-amino-4-hydroxy-6-hydroxymethyldihydropteridine diphosphokinase
MRRVYLSLGSNVEPRRHLRNALQALRQSFGRVEVSPVYESIAVGFEGDNFLNLVVAVDTELAVAQLSRELRQIESANGRRRDVPRFSSRTLDIDILTYGDVVGVIDGVQLPRPEIEQYGFVIKPLADIAANGRYPLTGASYQQMCQRMVTDDKALWRVDIDLDAAITH